MSGLAWLNDLMLWLGRWFPRLVLVKKGNVGVWFGPGGRVQELPAGLHWYWPLIADLTVVSTRIRTTEIACQLHGREAISIVVLYEIVQAKTMLLTQNNIFSLIDDRAQAYLSEGYGPDVSSQGLSAYVLGRLAVDMHGYGVHVHTVDVIQRGRVIPLKNLNDWAQHAEATL